MFNMRLLDKDTEALRRSARRGMALKNPITSYVASSGYGTMAPLFVVGNGYWNSGGIEISEPSHAQRSDVFTVLQSGMVGINIDSFYKTTSDAILQVNGQTVIGEFAQNYDQSGEKPQN